MDRELWQTLWLSLRVATLATVLAMLVAVPLAHVNRRRSYPGKSLLEGLVVVPLVLPPTVVGYLIIVLFGARGWLGQYLNAACSYSIVFRFEGAVIAAMIVALPLLYLPARAAFAAVDRESEDDARLMGASPLQLFWHVSLPAARRGLTSGVMLAFARAVGEFGATVMVFGIRPGRTTLPVSIYLDYEQGEMAHAAPAVAMLCGLSVALALLYNRSALSRQD